MVALALALQLAAASAGPITSPGVTPPLAAQPLGLQPLAPPSLAPQLDRGPFRGGELALASVGALAGDVLVLGGGYLALSLFANGTLEPTAGNFRTAAYALGVSALLVPPLTAVLLARLGARGPLAGALWKAVLLAAAGQAAALATGYATAPHFWLILPVQLATVSLGTSFGLHWGPHAVPAGALPSPAARREPRDPGAPAPTASLGTPMCPDA